MNIYELNKKNQVVTLDGVSTFGKDISEYGLENGYMDYKCLSNIFSISTHLLLFSIL